MISCISSHRDEERCTPRGMQVHLYCTRCQVRQHGGVEGALDKESEELGSGSGFATCFFNGLKYLALSGYNILPF